MSLGMYKLFQQIAKVLNALSEEMFEVILYNV